MIIPDTISGVASKDRLFQSNLSITCVDGSELDIGPVKWRMDVTKCYEGMDYIILNAESDYSASFECFWECKCWWCRLCRWFRCKLNRKQKTLLGYPIKWHKKPIKVD